jgi:hypothetical protein
MWLGIVLAAIEPPAAADELMMAEGCGLLAGDVGAADNCEDCCAAAFDI